MSYTTELFTIPQIIQIAKVSQYLFDDDNSNGNLYGQVMDPTRGLKLYVVRKDVEDVYALDTNYDGLIATSNYLYGLCDPRAISIVLNGGSGSSVIPGTVNLIKSPIMIYGNMFGSALGWDGVNNDGINILPSYTLQVFWNGLNRYLIMGDEVERTATGFNVIVNGTTITAFDALGANATDIFFVFISV